MIIYNYVGVQKILFNHRIRQCSQLSYRIDTFQMKFLDSREVVAKKIKYVPICTHKKKTSSNMHFTVICVHLCVVIRECEIVTLFMTLNLQNQTKGILEMCSVHVQANYLLPPAYAGG